MSFGLPDKPRDEDYGVNDDAGEWSPQPYLDDLGDEPVTLEGLIEWLSTHDDGIFHNLKVPVSELVERMKGAQK